MGALTALLRTPELRRFLVAGGLNTLLGYGLYLLFDAWLPYALAYLLAYAIGIVVQFVLFSRFVYRTRPDPAHALAYPLLHVVIAGFGTMALWAVIRVTGWPSSWAGLVAIALQTPVAFLLTRWWFASSTAPVLLTRFVERAGAALLLAAAAVFLLTTLLSVAQVGFRVPLWDQYRSYLLLLDTGFPLNVLQPENGHRPVAPNLLKLLDLELDGARQGVLLWSGALLAYATFGMLAFAAWRERGLSPLLRAAAVLAAALALCWLGNARMLLHGNEAVAIYWVSGWLVAGLLAVAAGASWRAGLCLAMGCFGFGNGPVIGCTLLLLLVLLRRPWPELIRVAAVFVTVVLLYTLVLPGSGGVRSPVELHPGQNLVDALRWLSGPWIQAWLGLAQHPTGFMRAAIEHLGQGGWLITSADWLTAQVGTAPVPAQMYMALRLGGLGLLLLMGLSLALWLRRLAPSRLRVIGLGLAWFAVGTGLLVAMSRQHFMHEPAQIFAERYLPWSCLFWLGLLLAALPSAAAPPRARLAAAVLAPLAMLGMTLMLWPTHHLWRGWAELVDRNSRVLALALAQDVLPPVLDQVLAIPAETDTWRSVRRLRAAGATVFDAGCTPPVDAAPASDESLQLAWTDPADGLSTETLRRLQGQWVEPIAGARILAYDQAGLCVGLGAMTWNVIVDGKRWSGPRRGIDVLVRVGTVAAGPLRLQLLDGAGNLVAVGEAALPGD